MKTRLYNFSPDLDSTDMYVGTLTVDEITFAGIKYGVANFDNYLIVFDIVSRKVLADSVKRFFGHLTVLAAIAGVVCACIFLI